MKPHSRCQSLESLVLQVYWLRWGVVGLWGGMCVGNVVSVAGAPRGPSPSPSLCPSTLHALTGRHPHRLSGLLFLQGRVVRQGRSGILKIMITT